MNPWQVIVKYAHTNPVGASLILGGTALFAAVALIIKFGLDLEATVAPALWLLAVAVLLSVVVEALNDPTIRRLMRWLLVVVGISWLVTFMAARLTDHPLANCAAYILSPCRDVADRTAEATVPAAGRPIVEVSPLDVPEGIAAEVQPSDYTVFVQFAGFVRDDVRTLMQQLAAAGWRVQGVAQGGERTVNAVGYLEVRYGAREDETAAQALASALSTSPLVQRSVATAYNGDISTGVLEVWISR